jgi:ABC-type phosphate transport system substrate-binding protein
MRVLAITVLLSVLLVTSPRAADEQYKVIVHPKNPVTELESDFVRNVYLKKAKSWGDGSTARPIDLPAKQAVRVRFTKDVLRKTPSQLKNYWNQQIFSGKAMPPPEAASPADVIAYVLANPGAIGYLPADVDAGGAKVVGIK